MLKPVRIELQHVGQVLRGHADSRALFWSISSAHDLEQLVPVQVDMDACAGWRASRRPPARRSPQLREVRADDAELHRIAHRRAVLQRVARGRARSVKSLSSALHQARGHAHRAPRCCAWSPRTRPRFGVEQLLVERQVEARAAAADVAPRSSPRPGRPAALSRSASPRARWPRSTRPRQPQVDHQLGPVGRREELLLHQSRSRRSTATKVAAVRPITTQRWRTHQSTKARTRR